MHYAQYWADRGFPWEHDPGPPKNLKWARLFSETPNYRGISKHVFGNDRFRWHFGPMYYRGRLKPNSVKVLIVGQEGAQDESLSHRSFTGSTGGRLQYLLHYLGITKQYLFLNTFVYPIFGQYSNRKLKWLAQDPLSPIAQHRFEIFDYALEKNDIKLVIAVGQAAKETIHNWIINRGGQCPDGTADLSTATGQFLDPGTRVLGVMHPGGLGNGGNAAAIQASFDTALRQIEQWIQADTNWLPIDDTGHRDFALPYTFGKAPIPFRDFNLGTCWRLGRGSTSSKRQDSQRSIQLFSETGQYVPNTNLHYAGLSPGSDDGYAQGPNDYPYEPPVDEHKSYDKGPTESFSKLIMGGKRNLHWPDFSSLGVTSHPSLGYSCILRGRPNESNFLVLADQQSHDDLFTTRALTGNSGQRLQAFLRAAGIDRSYCMIRCLPVDTLDLHFAQRKTICDHAQVQKVYRAIINKVRSYNDLEVVLVIGGMAQHLWDKLFPTFHLPVIKMKSWRQSGARADWQQALSTLQHTSYTTDVPPTFTYNGEREQIPRYDLPYGVLRWQGSSGDRTQRPRDDQGKRDGRYYKHYVPDWVFDSAPGPLSSAELNALNNIPS